MSERAPSDWEGLFWAVFGESRNAMAVVGPDRVLIRANGALQRRTGTTGEELTGQLVDGALPGADLQALADCWDGMLARGEGHGVVELAAGGGRARLMYAAHVAHVAGRLIVLVVLMDPDGEQADGGEPPAPLTPRETEIVSRIALGATSREIADELHVTTETIRTHVRNAMAKTGTRTRAHLVAAAICRGLLPAISSS